MAVDCRIRLVKHGRTIKDLSTMIARACLSGFEKTNSRVIYACQRDGLFTQRVSVGLVDAEEEDLSECL